MKRERGYFCRFCLLLLSAVVMLVGCARNKESPDTVLSELMGEEDALPKGEIYRSGVEEGSKGYPPSALLRAMYGEEGEEDIRLCEFSIYLSSFAVPLEIAVFRAPSKDHARRVYALCLSRMDTLRVALRHTEHAPLGEEIAIYRSGRYVVMGVTHDRNSFLKAVKREVG